MSLAYLASRQTARSRAFVSAQHAPAGRFGAERIGAEGNGGLSPAQVAPEDRYDLLTKYIPIETITIFTAAMSALDALLPEASGGDVQSAARSDLFGGATNDGLTIIIYSSCAVLTPIAYLLVLYGKHRMADDMAGKVFRPAAWPPIAATIAFLIWAWSIPGMEIKGFLEGEAARVVGAFAALLISTLLALLDPVLGMRTDPTPPHEADGDDNG